MPDNFFNIGGFKLKAIFKGVENVWDVLPKIKKFTGGKLIQGTNCKIAKSALLREGVILGDNVIIGHCVELKNCIVMDSTNIAHLSYIGDSIIGANANIGGGAILANFRLDEKSVYIKYLKSKIKTNLIKFGSIIGDGAKIGANAVLNPGTILGKNCIVYPLASVVGYYGANSAIK